MVKVSELFAVTSELMGYDEHDWAILEQEAATVRTWVPEIVSDFYDSLYAAEATKQIFAEGERAKVEKTLESWVLSLVNGKQDEAFWNHQWVVALIHVQRGVSNLFMLSMMNRVQQMFLRKCAETYDSEKAFRVYLAFLRISGAVAALIAECYTALMENITQEGVSRVGMNPALLQRIKESQIKKMMESSRVH